MNYNQPLFFSPNRVWRLYTGGKLLDEFTGTEHGSDGHFPEEWLASVVLANNGDHSQKAGEGLSLISLDNQNSLTLSDLLEKEAPLILGEKHFGKYGNSTAILCKYLDSAVRLPIQCHPDSLTAQKLYHSPFGKTECWHIISTRVIENEPPYILLGFRKDVEPLQFEKAVYEQNIPGMIGMLHKMEVHPGDTYFVPGRIPHAIGSGVFMLEVQEPSDWVIQPEQYCADIRLSHTDMWGPLTPEDGLKVFDYTGYTQPELMNRVASSNYVQKQAHEIKIIELIGSGHTQAFGLWKVIVSGKTPLILPVEFAIFVIIKGEGTIYWDGSERQLKQSDCFLMPATIQHMEFASDAELEMLVCLPPVI